ncbi:MAG: hypothetical protein ACM3NT_03885 [Methylocystaceae bacterium]
MYIVMVIVALVLLFLMEAPQLWKKKQTLDLVVFCGLLAISGAMGTIQALGLPLPNPVKWLLPVVGSMGL